MQLHNNLYLIQIYSFLKIYTDIGYLQQRIM
jgi:hypothetical protein